MPKVYVVNEPLGMYRGRPERIKDLSPAEAYGQLVYLTEPGNPPDTGFQLAVDAMASALASFRPEDYLLHIGHPALCCWAAALAARSSGGVLKVLVYQSRTKSYVVRQARLWANVQPLRGEPIRECAT